VRHSQVKVERHMGTIFRTLQGGWNSDLVVHSTSYGDPCPRVCGGLDMCSHRELIWGGVGVQSLGRGKVRQACQLLSGQKQRQALKSEASEASEGTHRG
jgi:hypothetical protein